MLIVQKYGGSSVGTVERIQAVAQRIVKTARDHEVVVVVSAMGKTTDGLVKLAKEISPNPNRREMDMLLATGEQVSIALVTMALQELGQPAISLTGAQVGIVTEAEHTRARILGIETERIEQYLSAGKVVVVAGFQGIANTENMEITTLGRGGSDTSAVALAAALQADRCEIYTDVPGILTTDPRLVPEAQLMDEITCDEMLELASLGAKVLHPRAVEIARNYGVKLLVLSSWEDAPGTLVVSNTPQRRAIESLELAKPVDAVEYDLDQGAVSLMHVPDRPGVAALLFGGISAQNIDVDLIIQSVNDQNTNDIAFTVAREQAEKAAAVARQILPDLGENSNTDLGESQVKAEDETIAKVSISGVGIIGRPQVAALMFKSLADAGINIQMISTSEVKLSCTINATECDRAVNILCHAFDVQMSPIQLAASVNYQDKIDSNSPPVRAVALDLNQARIAIRNLPDLPGMAAKVFGMLAAKNISVDMIIQSQRCRKFKENFTRDLAFTVAQGDAEMARSILLQASPEMGFSEIELESSIAKVSAVGSGMIAHPGVAAKVFSALSQEHINILMIATSEIKISCVVDRDQGIKSLQAIHSAFGLAGTKKFVVPS